MQGCTRAHPLLLAAGLLLSGLGCGGGSPVSDAPLITLDSPAEMLTRVRPASETNRKDGLRLTGYAYSRALPNRGIESTGYSTLRFAAEPRLSIHDQPLAVYVFRMLDPPAEPFMRVLWDAPGAGPSGVRYGVANFETDSWDWLPADAAGRISLDPLDNYLSSDMSALLAVLHTGDEPAELYGVRLGLTPTDRLYMVPEKTECAPGEHVRVTVYCEDTAWPLFYGNFQIDLGPNAAYVADSFDVGEPNGDGWNIDGIWAATGSSEIWQMPESWLTLGRTERNTLTASIIPMTLNWPVYDLENASGALFSFTLEVHGDTSLAFLHGGSLALNIQCYEVSHSRANYWWDTASHGLSPIRTVAGAAN